MFKQSLLLLLFCFISLHTIGQNSPKFETKEDYQEAESDILELCNYLLDNPIDQDEILRLDAIRYIMIWMQGTPDYTFNITQEAMDLMGNKTEDLLTIYLAALSKTVLDDAEGNLIDAQVEEQAIDYLIIYCAKESNNVKVPKPIKNEIKKRGN